MRGIGRHTYSMEQKPTTFDASIRKSLNGEPANESNPEERSPAKIREEFNLLARTDAEQAALLQTEKDADAFVKLHPEWKDTGKNARILLAFCAAQGISYPTLEDMDRVFPALVKHNLVELDERELARQADATAEARAKEFRAQAFNEEEAYSIPMEELKARAMRW